MELTVTKNKSNTLFINLDGELIADSSTWRRQRGFWNKTTQMYVDAAIFTPKNVAKNPELVIEFLTSTGTNLEQNTPVVIAY